MTAMRPESGIIADARPANWVDAYAPNAAKPYFKLARFDRPIGTWLLLLPCWFGLSMAQLAAGEAWPNVWYAALFAIGAIAMRGAGCTWNDIVDRGIDGRVERSALRPIPAGLVNVKQALAFGVAQALVGLIVLLQFNAVTIWLAISSLVIVAIYPFAKRFTYWPQLILGLAFNWGALVGWTAVHGSLSLAPLLLYVGAIAWTIGYDTIYAHQDKEDDALLGLKSTALKFGPQTPRWLMGLYSFALLFFGIAAAQADAGWLTYAGLAAVGLHFAWQIITLDTENSDNCLKRFKSNRDAGLILTFAVLADMAV